jgi:hypothetical protein
VFVKRIHVATWWPSFATRRARGPPDPDVLPVWNTDQDPGIADPLYLLADLVQYRRWNMLQNLAAQHEIESPVCELHFGGATEHARNPRVVDVELLDIQRGHRLEPIRHQHREIALVGAHVQRTTALRWHEVQDV